MADTLDSLAASAGRSNHMKNIYMILLGLFLLGGSGRSFGATTPATPDIVLSPTALAFSYQIGGTVPSPQPLMIKSTGGVVLAFTLAVTEPAACAGPCVAISANSGITPGNIQVYANPTGLPAGTYTSIITVNSPSAATPVQNVNVTLTVSDPPAALSVSTTSLAFTYTTGTPATAQSAPVVLMTSGDAVNASVTASGGTWLKATPSGAIALMGMPQTITVTADATGLAPSATPYKGTVTIASPNASNKSVVVNVALTVSAGNPTIAATNGIWPPGAPAGTSTPVTITITGTNFFSTSTVAVGATALTNIKLVNPTTLQAAIPPSLLAAKGNLPIVVTTPTAATPSAPGSFTVYDPAAPQVWAVVNGGSYKQGVVSPGEVITIYGAGLGPAVTTQFSGTSLPLSLANTSVMIDGHPMPLLYTSATQVSGIVPLAVAPGTASGPNVNVVVKYNGATAPPLPVSVVAADPGIFTLTSSGQAAVLNINTNVMPADYSVNSPTNPTHAGSWIAIYATGFGATSCVAAAGSPCDSPAPTEAQFVGGGMVTPVGTVGVTIGGVAVTSPVGVVPVGSVIGLLQVNVQVPATVTAGTAVPVVLSIAGVNSAGVATIAVK
jgi:uncharacterized protein (TIGR03437 family)